MPLSEAWVDFVAGWASGAVAVWTCQPVDTVLTRMQAGPALVVGNASPRWGIQGKNLIQSFGWTSLWRGSSAMISAVPMQNALLMGGYGMGKQWAGPENETANAAASNTLLASVFVGGCTGGVIQSFLMSPVELVKVNQQVHVTKTASVATRELWTGFANRTSWRGLNATLLRDGIPHGFWFLTYEWCKTEMTSRLVVTSRKEESPNITPSTTDSIVESVVIPMTSGAVAATAAWVCPIFRVNEILGGKGPSGSYIFL